MSFGPEYPHNRRASPRWQASFPLEYGKPEPRKKEPVEPVEGEVLQMSLEGLAFQGSTVFPVGTELALRFRADADHEVSPSAVVRAQQGNVMRVQFVRLSRQERLSILDHFVPR